VGLDGSTGYAEIVAANTSSEDNVEKLTSIMKRSSGNAS
jgi:hypothetical protein